MWGLQLLLQALHVAMAAGALALYGGQLANLLGLLPSAMGGLLPNSPLCVTRMGQKLTALVMAFLGAPQATFHLKYAAAVDAAALLVQWAVQEVVLVRVSDFILENTGTIYGDSSVGNVSMFVASGSGRSSLDPVPGRGCLGRALGPRLCARYSQRRAAFPRPQLRSSALYLAGRPAGHEHLRLCCAPAI